MYLPEVAEGKAHCRASVVWQMGASIDGGLRRWGPLQMGPPQMGSSRDGPSIDGALRRWGPLQLGPSRWALCRWALHRWGLRTWGPRSWPPQLGRTEGCGVHVQCRLWHWGAAPALLSVWCPHSGGWVSGTAWAEDLK